ncbi:MAG: DUF3267 domain-containing protein [bacterium]|nr:DUF3267 domain-containing protein [bacterium]
MAPAITSLPDGYRETQYLHLTSMENLTRLNLYSLFLVVPFLLLMVAWTAFAQASRGANPGELNVPSLLLWAATLLVLPLHELVHGLAIAWTGHRPRYGAKYLEGSIKLPYVLYATADGALFRRYEFIVIALAPAIVLTLVGMGLVWVTLDSLASYIAVAVVLNGAGAIGDFWMTAVVLRYPKDALVRDEEDGIRIFTR